MIISALVFATGIGLYWLQPSLPATAGVLTIAGLALLLLIGTRRWRWLLPIALLAIGFVFAHHSACQRLCPAFPESLVRQNLLVVGRVATMPDLLEDGVRFHFVIEQATHLGEPIALPQRVRLSWYRHHAAVLAGERWQLEVRLRPPHGFINQGGFDYERWLFQHGIGATGTVRASSDNQRLSTGAARDAVERWRQSLRAKLMAAFPEAQDSALLRALVLGDRGGLTSAHWTVFSRTGTSHLIAISGLHVGVVATAVFFLVRRGWGWVPALALRFAAPRAAALVALLAGVLFSALAGFAISTQRALIMLAVVLLALIMRRTLRLGIGLAWALVGVLVIDPPALLSYGFWLSFGAVAMLLYVLSGHLSAMVKLEQWIRAQWAVTLGLLPLLLLLFSQASLLAPMVNLIAIPLFTVLLPFVLTATVLLWVTGWGLPLAAINALLQWGYTGLAWVAALPWAMFDLGTRPLWMWLTATLGALLLLAPRGLPGRWLGLILFAPLLLFTPPAPLPGQAWLTVLDVGQGLAVVVRTQQHTLVYDLGPIFPSGFNTAEAVVIPFLRAQGIRQVDHLMISHAHSDHFSDLPAFLNAYPVTRLTSGEPQALKVAAELCQRDHRWQWDGVEFHLLHPPHPLADANDSSCVLQIKTAGASALLTGDISRQIEGELVTRLGDGLASDVLLAAHHGSATSSSERFLRAVNPQWIIYPTGYANRFRFPTASVTARVERLGIASLNTATSGAIGFVLTAEGLESPTQARQQNRRLWRHVPLSAPW